MDVNADKKGFIRATIGGNIESDLHENKRNKMWKKSLEWKSHANTWLGAATFGRTALSRAAFSEIIIKM